MNECLDYIKKTGEEIKELNLKIQSEMEENKELRKQIARLEQRVKQRDYELEDARKLANRWWNEYDELSARYDNLEGVTDAMSIALSKIAPALYNEIEEDIREAKTQEFLWDNIANDFKRARW